VAVGAQVAVEEGVAAFLEKLAATWSENDGPAFAEHFVEDGALVNPFGERADGRAALASMYGDYFSGMLQGTTTTISLTALRQIDDDHVFADADQSIHGADGSTLMALHVVNLLRRAGDGWQLVDSRPYAFQQPPPA
jgi:uncharacterized protein (TIGR02246 family)